MDAMVRIRMRRLSRVGKLATRWHVLVAVGICVGLAFANGGRVGAETSSESPGSEGVVVDGWGGLKAVTYGASPTISSFNRAAYWLGWDIVRGVALRGADPSTCASFGGYTLDGWGALHPFGINGKNPPAKPRTGPYWKGWDIARNVALVPADPRDPDSPPAGGFVLDGWGGLHYFTIDAAVPKPVITGGPYWQGWDIASGLIILTAPGVSGGYRGGFVVDGWGGLHPFAINGQSPSPVDYATAPYWPGWDIARGGTGLAGSSVNGGLVLDGWGGLHPFTLGAGPAPSTAQIQGSPYWQGWDIARGISMRQKKVCP